MLAETLETIATPALIDERLSLRVFSQLAGNLSGYPFVKVVFDREKQKVHFLNHAVFKFHGEYISQKLMGITREEWERTIDDFNRSVYQDPERRFFLGIISLHKQEEKSGSMNDTRFFSIETVEIDTMDASMIQMFFKKIREFVDPTIPLLFKPASHLQEKIISQIDSHVLPRVFNHELFASAQFICLHPGKAIGRLRAFSDEKEYQMAKSTLHWHDIIVMHRVPDDIPRVSGMINAHPTTPLSHTNILASGWRIPNAIQLGVFDRILKEKLNGQWVLLNVDPQATEVKIEKVEKPETLPKAPSWSVHQIKLEEPEVANTKIQSLKELRISDRYRYGTKAANLGELNHVLNDGSERLLGFYRIPRPPRENLLAHLAKYLGTGLTSDRAADLTEASWRFLRRKIKVPRGIAIPFSIQQEFLESSPRIQQGIGKLKMALELDAREIDSLCLNLEQLVRSTRMPEKVRSYIDSQIACHLSGVKSFVVRSSSNAEDLEGFSAAGIYESINHVSTADRIFESIKDVWASLLSPRSVRLRHEVGISLDDSYMGVIVQEEVGAEMGGVLVTTNPMAAGDFRNVYANVSTHSVTNIVQGSEMPYQFLFNTVEGGGKTISMGSAQDDLSDDKKTLLQDLSFAGRLLQSHFSPDYLFNSPVDIEWVSNGEEISILQLRPYVR